MIINFDMMISQYENYTNIHEYFVSGACGACGVQNLQTEGPWVAWGRH